MMNTRSKRKAEAELETVAELPPARKCRRTTLVMRKNAASEDKKTGGTRSSLLPEKRSTAKVGSSRSVAQLKKRLRQGKERDLSGGVVNARRSRERRKLPKVQCKRSLFRNLKQRRRASGRPNPVPPCHSDGEDLLTYVQGL